ARERASETPTLMIQRMVTRMTLATRRIRRSRVALLMRVLQPAKIHPLTMARLLLVRIQLTKILPQRTTLLLRTTLLPRTTPRSRIALQTILTMIPPTMATQVPATLATLIPRLHRALPLQSLVLLKPPLLSPTLATLATPATPATPVRAHTAPWSARQTTLATRFACTASGTLRSLALLGPNAGVLAAASPAAGL
ncbi:hypothetical protein FBU59_004570, partial [Linderina macrospora]